MKGVILGLAMLISASTFAQSYEDYIGEYKCEGSESKLEIKIFNTRTDLESNYMRLDFPYPDEQFYVDFTYDATLGAIDVWGKARYPDYYANNPQFHHTMVTDEVHGTFNKENRTEYSFVMTKKMKSKKIIKLTYNCERLRHY